MKPVKGIVGKIFSRFVIMVVLILIQTGWIALAVLKLGQYTQYTQIAFNVLSVLMALFVVYRDDNPAYKLGWILLIVLVPILGSTMYLFFGNKRPSRSLSRMIDPVTCAHEEDARQEYDLGEISSDRLIHTLQYISDYGRYPAWSETKTKYYDLADKAFQDMLFDLARAEHYIFMEYFIVAEGYMWDRIYDILRKKAEKGVDVRLIYDDIGSIDRVPFGFADRCERDGIKTVVFNPLKPLLSLVYNNRDHRKIVVIDGYIGYSGGYNIGDEYINRVSRFGHWKDTGIRLEGRGVWNYTLMFLNMWNAFRKTESDYAPYRPDVYNKGPFYSDGIVQPFSDSPLDWENLGENVYMELLNQAQDYVYIYTPYLILDNEMKTAMTLAAKRGVDVRLVTPGIPDKHLIYRLTRSYYRPLINAGVKIYEYIPGFIHAKSCISDDRIGVVGTINLDYRSLFLHFECGTLMVGCAALRDLKEDCERTFARSREITEKDCYHTFIGLLFDSVLRVISPLL